MTESDKGADTDAESKAAVDAEETARMKERERKRKERGAAAAAKPIQGESSTSVSTLMPARSSPRKSPEKSLRPGPVSVLNWSPSDDVRMVEQLAETFSDVAFQGDVPDDWGWDEHLSHNKLYTLWQGRVSSFMKDK